MPMNSSFAATVGQTCERVSLSNTNVHANKAVVKRSVRFDISKGVVAAPEYNPKEIIFLRKRLGLTRRDFGVVLGVSTWSIIKWEMGVSKPEEVQRRSLYLLTKPVR